MLELEIDIMRSPMAIFLIKVLLVTILVAIPAILLVYQPAIIDNNPEYIILFILPSVIVVFRKLTRRVK